MCSSTLTFSLAAITSSTCASSSSKGSSSARCESVEIARRDSASPRSAADAISIATTVPGGQRDARRPM